MATKTMDERARSLVLFKKKKKIQTGKQNRRKEKGYQDIILPVLVTSSERQHQGGNKHQDFYQGT